MASVKEARQRAEDRKAAAGVRMGLEEEEAEAVARRLFVGFDIDVDELLEVAAEVRRASLVGAGLGVGPGMLGMSFFLEGFLVGLLAGEASIKSEGGGLDATSSD